MNTDKKYNGWANYETWLCNLHYDNFFEEQAQEYWNDAEADKTFTRSENAALALKDYIESTVEEFTQEAMPTNPFLTDMINACLSEINYYEIARSYIADVDKSDVENSQFGVGA